MSDNGLDFKPIISYTYSISILMINFKSFFHKYTYCTIILSSVPAGPGRTPTSAPSTPAPAPLPPPLPDG